MFGAIGRFFRAIGYFFTGKVDDATKELSQSPHVVQATYAKIIEEKKGRIQQYKEAVAGLIAQEEKKLDTVKRLTGSDKLSANRIKAVGVEVLVGGEVPDAVNVLSSTSIEVTISNLPSGNHQIQVTHGHLGAERLGDVADNDCV